MSKIGRNDKCTCGSGKKFKHCHGSLANPLERDAFVQAVQKAEAEEAQRKNQQGLGKPIISAQVGEQRIVAVGNRVHYSNKWRTFHDFLRDFLIGTLGNEWFQEQVRAPEAERHPIAAWYTQAIESTKHLTPEKHTGIITGPMTGAHRAFLNLAYNTYLIAHHSDPEKADQIVDSFVWRLKSVRQDDFVGKLFETYASAVFLKAGFEVEYENERDGSDSHVEFVATYPETGKKFSVEVKTRNPQFGSDGPVDDVKRLRVGAKLKKALAKSANHMRIVFIEVNVPDVVTADYAGTWVENALEQIREAETHTNREGSLYPQAYVVVTNHAFHNHLSAHDIGVQAVAEGFRIDDFGPSAQVQRFREYLDNLNKHAEILALFDSMKEHSSIPTTFDGEIPEFAFGRLC